MSYGLKLAYMPGWDRTQSHLGPARKLTSNRMTYTSAKCTVNEILMMGRGTVQNM